MVSRIKSLIASRCDRRASNHPAYKVITSLLVPRCALCDTVHLSPNRLCGDCITSLECHHRQTPSSSDAVVARDSLAHPSAVGLPRTQHQSQGNAFIPDVRRLDSAFYYQGKVPDLITHWKYKGMLLFHISVFWSFMSDLFSKEQAGRLFGIIAAGASVGGLIGPSIPSFFSASLGTDNLLLLASAMLLVPIPIIFYLQSLKSSDLQNEGLAVATPEVKIGGNPLAGFKLFFSNPYLMAIGLFIFLYTGISSFVYFELKNLLSELSRAERTAVWAQMDLAVNVLSIAMGLFATGRIIGKFGMPVAIAFIPVLICAGLVIVAVSPFLGAVVALQVIRRAVNYGVTKPAREVLFTRVDREARFKAKPVIDIVAYRGGDMLMAWLFTGLTQGLGLGLAAVAAVGAGIAALWSLVGIYLGRWFEQEEAQRVDELM